MKVHELFKTGNFKRQSQKFDSADEKAALVNNSTNSLLQPYLCRSKGD